MTLVHNVGNRCFPYTLWEGKYGTHYIVSNVTNFDTLRLGWPILFEVIKMCVQGLCIGIHIPFFVFYFNFFFFKCTWVGYDGKLFAVCLLPYLLKQHMYYYAMDCRLEIRGVCVNSSVVDEGARVEIRLRADSFQQDSTSQIWSLCCYILSQIISK